MQCTVKPVYTEPLWYWRFCSV